MATYHQICDSHHLLADCQELGSALEPYVRQASLGYLYLYMEHCEIENDQTHEKTWFGPLHDSLLIVLCRGMLRKFACFQIP